MTTTRDEQTNRGAPSPVRYVEEGAALMQMAPPNPAGRLAAGGGGREAFDVIVIGAGQAGLSVGYHLARRGVRFVMLDACERVGDVWRKRWDSLRLFTPARYDGLVGMPFPAPPHSFPTKDEMADYLESYARHFALPIRHRTRVTRVRREGTRYVVTIGDHELTARHVVVAMANYQRNKVPDFASELDPAIRQIHAGDYRNPSQLRSGPVLVVGGGNSGSEIAKELSRDHQVWISGRDTGHLPFRVGGLLGRLVLTRLVLRVIFHRVLTVRTALGRKVYPVVTSGGGPLIRVLPKDLAALGVEWLPKTAGAENGLPRLEDGRVLDVANVVWCTGFQPGFSWIDLPVFGEDGKPRHRSGIVEGEPGLYFVGLHFLHSLSSVMIHGVGRDAERVVDVIASRTAQRDASLATQQARA